MERGAPKVRPLSPDSRDTTLRSGREEASASGRYSTWIERVSIVTTVGGGLGFWAFGGGGEVAFPELLTVGIEEEEEAEEKEEEEEEEEEREERRREKLPHCSILYFFMKIWEIDCG